MTLSTPLLDLSLNSSVGMVFGVLLFRELRPMGYGCLNHEEEARDFGVVGRVVVVDDHQQAVIKIVGNHLMSIFIFIVADQTSQSSMTKDKKKNGGGEAKNKGEGGKKEERPIPVVLKIDFHCDGCATRIIKSVRGIDGVEAVKADCATNKLTVVGKVDPAKLREKLKEKTKKEVELISPLPKEVELISPLPKKGGGGGGDKKKADEPPVTTAVLKMNRPCEECVQRIHRITSRTRGVQTHSIDRQKDLITVKGTMDAQALAETLKEKLKRPVEIVPPKKDKEGDDKKEKGGGGGRGREKGGGDGGAGKEEENRMNHIGHGYDYGYGYGYMYPGYTVQPLHAPQIFSDENPNACSVM